MKNSALLRKNRMLRNEMAGLQRMDASGKQNNYSGIQYGFHPAASGFVRHFDKIIAYIEERIKIHRLGEIDVRP